MGTRIGVAMAVLLLAGPVSAADRATPPTFSSTARIVRVPVSILDEHGEPVLDLKREEFHISENGRRQPLTFFSGERRPIRIVVALDVSLSMAPVMLEVQRALEHFIDLLEPADETLVITFAE